MNIFSINSVTKPIVPQNQSISYNKYNNSQDAFIRTPPAQPSFKGKMPEDKLAEMILKNPKLFKLYKDFTTDFAVDFAQKAFFALFGLASATDILKLFGETLNENVPETVEDSIDENPDITKATDDITDDEIRVIGADDTNSEEDEINPKQEHAVYDENEAGNSDINLSDTGKADEQEEVISSVKQFEFPAKKGRYAEGHTLLKSVSETLSLQPDEYKKLTAICIATSKKTVTDYEGNVRAGYDVAMEVARALQEDSTDIKQVINDYFDKLNLANQELLVDNTEIVPGAEDSDGLGINELSDAGNEIPDDNTTLSELRKKRGQGPVVLGKLDLDSLGRGAKPREGQEALKESNEIPEGNDNLTDKGTKAKPFTDPDNQVYSYIAPGTVLHAYDGLKKLLRAYESTVFNIKKDIEYVAWAHRSTTALNVTKRNIINEIRIHKGINCFKNINSDNAEIIADVINSDRRFGQYFTIHGAMRLIDRYADFNLNESIYDQCTKILDCFEKTIKVGLKKTVSVTRTVSDYDKKGNKYYSLRALFNPSFFAEDAKKFFGTKPLVIVMGEYQPGIYEKDFRKKQPIILTVYPEEY